MDPMEKLAEARIQEAVERGELSNLAGEGKPLNLEETDPLMPAELRMAYRVLKNANCLPPELTARREIRELEELLQEVGDAGEGSDAARQARRRLATLRVQVEQRRGTRSPLWADPPYQNRLLAHLGDKSGKSADASNRNRRRTSKSQ